MSATGVALELEFLPADLLGLDPFGAKALSGGYATIGSRPYLPRDASNVVPAAPVDVDEIRARAETIEKATSSFRPPVASLDALRAVADGATVVATVVRPGLLGGTLADLHRCLATVRLVRALRRANADVSAIAVVDDDHHRLGRALVPNEHLDLTRVGLAGLDGEPRRLGRLVLDEERHRTGAFVEQLRQLLPVDAASEAAIELLAPRAGESIAEGTARVFLELLGPLGLAVVPSTALRPELDSALAETVADDPFRRLDEGGEALGWGRSVDPFDDDEVLVWRHEDELRRPLGRGGDGFRYPDEPGSRRASELAAEIVGEPGGFSPGALFPAVLARLFPVSAVVADLRDLPRCALTTTWCAPTSRPPAAIVPRPTSTLTTPEDRTAAERLGVTIREVVSGSSGPSAAPESKAALGLDRLAEHVRSELARLRPDVAEVDRGLASQMRRTTSRVVSELGELRKRVERVESNRVGGARRHWRRLETMLRPGGNPQEEVLSLLPFLARFGTGWIEKLAHEVDAFPGEHLAVHLAGSDPEALDG